MDALRERLGADRLHRLDAVAEHGAEDLDHLAVAVRNLPELAPNALEEGRQGPFLEGRPVA